MRYIIALTIVLHTSLIFSQTRVFILLKDDCQDSSVSLDWEVLDLGYKITKEGNSPYYTLEFMKEYFVSSVYFRGNYMRPINFSLKITERDSMVKLVEVPKLSKFYTGNSFNFDEKYFICEQLCNGYCIDYYSNGNKRIEGYFVNGIPRKKLVYYNQDGSKEYSEKYSKSGKLKKTIKFSASD